MGSKDQNQSKRKLKNSWQPKVGRHQESSEPPIEVMEQHDFMEDVEQQSVSDLEAELRRRTT
jgi:hypothetical protein